MLKWLDKLNGLEAEADSSAAAAVEQKTHSVLDVAADTAEVMDDAGETVKVELGICDQELVAALRRAFDEEKEMQVLLGTRHGKTGIVKLTVQ